MVLLRFGFGTRDGEYSGSSRASAATAGAWQRQDGRALFLVWALRTCLRHHPYLFSACASRVPRVTLERFVYCCPVRTFTAVL